MKMEKKYKATFGSLFAALWIHLWQGKGKDPKTWIRWEPKGLFNSKEIYVTATTVKCIARALRADWDSINREGKFVTDSYHYRKREIPSRTPLRVDRFTA
jgi:hypothetical protein